jgi:hypothetical protein
VSCVVGLTVTVTVTVTTIDTTRVTELISDVTVALLVVSTSFCFSYGRKAASVTTCGVGKGTECVSAVILLKLLGDAFCNIVMLVM